MPQKTRPVLISIPGSLPGAWLFSRNGKIRYTMPNMHKVEVRESPIEGRGVFAHQPIAAGAQIGTYHGKRTMRNGKYVLWVTDEDGTEYGISGRSKLRYLNHSGEPNAEFYGDELYALRDIDPEEEITFHYGELFEEWLETLSEAELESA